MQVTLGPAAMLAGSQERRPRRRALLRQLLLLPDELISRIRGLFLVFVLVNGALIPLAMLGVPEDGAWQRVTTGVALAGLSWWWVLGYRRGRFPILGELGEAVAMYVLVTGVREPLFLLSFLYVSLAFRSLYGTLPVNAVRAALYLLAYLGPMHATEAFADNPAFVLAQVPAFAMVALLMHVLANALLGHARMSGRERALAEAQAAFLTAEDRDAISEVSLRAARTIAGGEVVVVTGGPGGLEVAASSTVAATGRPIPASTLVPVAAMGGPVTLARPASAAIRLSLGLGPSTLPAVAVPLSASKDLLGALVVWVDDLDEDDVLDALRHLASGTALALERVDLAEDLTVSEHRFRTLVQNSSDVVTVVDAHSEVSYVTPSVDRVLGYQPTDLVGTRLKDLVHPEDLPYALEFFIHARDVADVTSPMQWRMRHHDGSWRHVEIVGSNLLDDPTVSGLVLTARDVSERTELQEQLTRQAFHDPLTGLANRMLFTDRVEHALSRAARVGEQVAVLMIDLDDFKGVNDTLGHAAGDELLVAVAERLDATVRPGDTVARLGGDEFAVLLEGVSTASDAPRVGHRILDTLRGAVTISGRELFPHGSIGCAIGGYGGERVDELLRMADVAMYIAKERGRSRFEMFEPSMHAALLDRRQLKSDLQRAVDDGEILVHFQPITDLATSDVVGFEALARWWHRQRGLVLPGEFVSAAEENGVIVPLGEHVLRTACEQVRAWQDRYGRTYKVNVNVAWRQLQEDGFVSTVSRALQDSGLPATSLVIEITETALAHDTPATIDRLAALKALGVVLAVDDFGVGYSSLSYLRRFPIDILKIDRAFVEGVTGGAEESALARAIVKLAEALHLTTVAEGIEDADQVRALLEMGCTQGQGFYYAAPLDALSVESMLEATATNA